MNKNRMFFRGSVCLITSLLITLAGYVALSAALFKGYSEFLWAGVRISLWPYWLLEKILKTGNIATIWFWGVNIGGWMLMLFPVSFIRFRKSLLSQRLNECLM